MPARFKPAARLFWPVLLACLLALGSGPALASGGGGHGGGKEGGAAGNQLALEPFFINLSDRGATAYVKLVMTIQLKDEKKKPEISERLPGVRDSILLLLSSKSSKALETDVGKNRLKVELRKLIAERSGLPEDQITIFFTDFIIQYVR